MADITQIYSQFKSERELQQFCEAQYKTILELSNKLRSLQEKNKSLEKMLSQAVPLEVKPGSDKEIADEELICITQIKLLKSTSEERELTLEESKKFDTYVKLLQSINSKKNKKDDPLEGMNEEDLLKVLDNANKP